MLRIILASLHLLALALGLGGVVVRATALSAVSHSTPASADSLRRAFAADSAWGVAALLWISTGLWRLLGSVEKSTDYYTHNKLFMMKMGLFILIFLLELWPMITLIKWRIAIRRGAKTEIVATQDKARRIATISTVQALILVAMIFVATAMARGYGAMN